ncbi:MAG: YbaK/EbsC family protein [Candidatus Rokubacteria bacterium]|nr:YbaK/EbsC family protein [Candidatus Rokubacteria bacterium]
MYQRLEEFLGAKQAQYEVLTHTGAVTAQEQAALTHTPGRVFAKVVVVKERDGFVLAVLPATSVLDLDRLKGLIRHGEIRPATVDEIGRVIPDCVPGAIPPFGALFGLPTYVDRTLANGREITMPAGDLATAIRMRAAEFRRLSAACIGDFAVPESLVAGSSGVARGRPRRRRAR